MYHSRMTLFPALYLGQSPHFSLRQLSTTDCVWLWFVSKHQLRQFPKAEPPWLMKRSSHWAWARTAAWAVRRSHVRRMSVFAGRAGLFAGHTRARRIRRY